MISYNLANDSAVVDHGLVSATLLHDVEDESELEIDAQVASGDCFVMLATALDQLTGEEYGNDLKLVKPQLERYIHTLLYLQRHYQISRRSPEFRQ